MLLTVKKQVEETLEIKTPCYYKSPTGYHHINDYGDLIQASERMINMWSPSDGKYLNEAIQQMLNYSKPCTKEEFDKAYAEAMAKMNAAAGLGEVNHSSISNSQNKNPG